MGVCRACPRLVAWREEVAVTKRRAFAGEPYWGRPIPGWGDERAWLLSSASPRPPTAATGRAGSSPATAPGDWIFAALHRAGLATQEHSVHAADGQRLVGARMAAPVRCAPPANKPLPVERDTCAPWFDRELTLLAPTLRVRAGAGRVRVGGGAGGGDAAGLDGAGAAAAVRHGASVALARPDGPAVTLLATYHVSQQNTFTGKLTEAMLDDVLARARTLAA